MWLDRLAGTVPSSGATSPQPNSRPYSPLPKRTSSNLGPYGTSQHRATSNSPRGSSVFLVSNDSNTSLLSQQRKPNAPGLRQSPTVFNGPNPADVLEKLLQIPPEDQKQFQGLVTQEDINLVSDFGGLSLRALAGSKKELDGNTSSATGGQSALQDCKSNTFSY